MLVVPGSTTAERPELFQHSQRPSVQKLNETQSRYSSESRSESTSIDVSRISFQFRSSPGASIRVENSCCSQGFWISNGIPLSWNRNLPDIVFSISQ